MTHPRCKATLRIALTFEIAGRSTRGSLTPNAIIHEMYPMLETPLVRILGHAVNGDDELIVQLDAVPARWKVHALAENLWQDYITVRDLDAGETYQVGPHAPKERVWPWPMLDVFDVPIRYQREVPRGTYAGQPFANPQPLPLAADTADFSDFGDCTKLATLGVFHTDGTQFKRKRSEQRAAQLVIAGAYEWLGLDRTAESVRIQGEVAGLLPEGIWPRSSGLYASRMHALDEHVLARAERQGYSS